MPREIVYKPTAKAKKIFTGGTIEPPKYMPTFFEWLLSKGLSVSYIYGMTRGSTGGLVGVLYTVPAGFVLYLISTHLVNECSCSVAGGGTGASSVNISSPSITLLKLSLDHSVVSHVSQQLSESYPVPFRINAGGKIQLDQVAIVTSGTVKYSCSAGFTGILVKNRDIPSF